MATVEGNIIFGGNWGAPPAKYAIVPALCRADEIISGFFGEEVPKALISVIGTLELDLDEDKFEKVFNNGLILAAENSSAWIVTSGLNRGAADCVGNGIHKTDAEVRCVGVAPLNRVAEHDLLMTSGEHEYFVVKGPQEALEQNHTHFFLVEHDQSEWGPELDFRSNLEDYYSHTRNVPTVLVAVGGSPLTFKIILKELRKGNPVVVVDQSGHASDAITSYLRHNDDSGQFKLDAWEEYLHDLRLTDKSDFIAIMEEIAKYRTRIIIYDPTEDGNMDKAVLRSILHYNPETNLETQMALAVKWGRVDMIEELLEQDVKSDVKSKAIDASLQTALEFNQPTVFELLIKKGGNVTFVDLDKLYRINDEGMEKFKPIVPGYWRGRLPLKGGKSRQSTQVESVADVSMPLLSGSNKFAGRDLAQGVLRTVHSNYMGILDDVQSSYMGVLVWAILINRDELAKTIWRNMAYPVHAAIIASHLNTFLAERFQDDEIYEDKAQWFEDKAISVLSEMTSEHAISVLKLPCPELNGLNVLQIANLTNCKDFTSHPYVQRYMNEKLYGDEYAAVRPETKLWQVFGLTIFPFMLPFSDSYMRADESVGYLRFYNLPVTKLVTWTISHLVFLALLSYIVMESSLTTYDIPWYEFILWGWVACVFVEEFEQFRTSDGTYFKNLSNQIDVVRNLGFVIYIVVRILAWQLKSPAFVEAYVDVLIVCNIICYFRLIHVFTVNKDLGTLFFIIVRLFNDVLLWMLICFVFMIGFQIGIFALTKEAGEDPWVFYPTGTLGAGITTFFGDPGENTMGIMQATSIGVIFLVLYSVLSQIMLVNLLIAMMGSTYGDVKDNSDKEWKFYRYGLINEFDEASPYPPPLNILLFPFYFLARLCSSDTSVKAEKSGSNLITKMRLAKDKALEKERAEEIQSIEFLSDFVQNSTHQATVQANSDRSAIKTTLKKMHTSINAQFKNFEDVLAKQQRTFEEMQASTMAQFKQFHEILGNQQVALANLQLSSENIAALAQRNAELQTAAFQEINKNLATQQAGLQVLQESSDVIAAQTTQNKELLALTSAQFQELSKKIESSGSGATPAGQYKEIKQELDNQMTAIGVIQHSLVNLHQSMDKLLKGTLRASGSVEKS